MDYKKYNDNELIYMVQENDEVSSGILLKKYAPILMNISKRYYDRSIGCGYELEDFYQEALASFYKAITTYDSSLDVLFYSFVVLCVNRSLSSYTRKIFSHRNKSLDTNNLDINEYDYCIEDIRENPNIRESYKGLENIVRDVIFSLPMESGAILELKINGFTYKEIGVLLDIPMSSVEFRSRRARNILRNKVKAYYCK
jgi:RNA polymerase sigma factor (sigma-70 family)